MANATKGDLPQINARTADMSIVFAKGIAEPFDPEAELYPAFGSRTPALHGFRLTYPEKDHEITLIQVLAGGSSQDLSPFADLLPANIPDGQLRPLIQDAGSSGEEFSYYVAHAALRVPGSRRYQIRDVGCVGEGRRRIPPIALRSPLSVPALGEPLIALTGFRLFFTGVGGNSDHNLDQIGIRLEGDEFVVTMRDKNGDDPFGYLVDFVVIPATSMGGLNVSTGTEEGTDAIAVDTHPLSTPSHSEFLLVGWQFNFEKGDHKIRDLGIFRRADDLTVIYGNSAGNDSFDWRVDWAHVGPMVIAPE